MTHLRRSTKEYRFTILWLLESLTEDKRSRKEICEWMNAAKSPTMIKVLERLVSEDIVTRGVRTAAHPECFEYWMDAFQKRSWLKSLGS